MLFHESYETVLQILPAAKLSLIVLLTGADIDYDSRDLRRIVHTINCNDVFTAVIFIACSRPDYCNSIYHALLDTQLKPCQQIQNARARAVWLNPKQSCVTPAMKLLQGRKV